MTKYRIQKEIVPQKNWEDEISYVIQEKHWWNPLWIDSYQFCWYYSSIRKYFTLNEAQKEINLLSREPDKPVRINI